MFLLQITKNDTFLTGIKIKQIRKKIRNYEYRGIELKRRKIRE